MTLLRYWYWWMAIAGFAAVVLLWLAHATGDGRFTTLAIAEAILAVYWLWMKAG